MSALSRWRTDGRGGQGARHSGCHGDVRKSSELRQPGRRSRDQDRNSLVFKRRCRLRRPDRVAFRVFVPSPADVADRRRRPSAGSVSQQAASRRSLSTAALLFYFGYVSARSQYEYFGSTSTRSGSSTQDYVIGGARSPCPRPTAGATSLLAVGRTAAGRRDPGPDGPDQRGTAYPARGDHHPRSRGARPVPLPVLGGRAYYALVVPLVIGLAAAVLAYCPT